MTDQLLRGNLDDKSPAPVTPKQPTLEDLYNDLAEAVGATFSEVASAFEEIAKAFSSADSQSNYALVPAPLPTDPRAKALEAKNRRGKGPPSSSNRRGRERNTKYRSQS